MTNIVKERVARGLRGLGYEVTRRESKPWPDDFQPADIDLYQAVAPYTMTGPEAVYALADAVRYVVASDIPGAIVECGVWRGGSMMAVARTLRELGETDRELYLFDTYDGMPAPSGKDVQRDGESAASLLARQERGPDASIWAVAPLTGVRDAMATVGYTESRVHFVQGKVEDTVPAEAPDEIALLRLDTDWYESTRHELDHLYPRLVPAGVLILDDYGWWRGAGEATDEYFRAHPPMPLLVRIDDKGKRIAIKPHA